jgi:hypothetical protein
VAERVFLGVGEKDLFDTSELADKSTWIFLEGILKSPKQVVAKKRSYHLSYLNSIGCFPCQNAKRGQEPVA